MSADGRYVMFQFARTTNLVAGVDTHTVEYLRSTTELTGTTELVKHEFRRHPEDEFFTSYGTFISADGRFVLFHSRALDPGCGR